jgi:hypothetical protein
MTYDASHHVWHHSIDLCILTRNTLCRACSQVSFPSVYKVSTHVIIIIRKNMKSGSFSGLPLLDNSFLW